MSLGLAVFVLLLSDSEQKRLKKSSLAELEKKQENQEMVKKPKKKKTWEKIKPK